MSRCPTTPLSLHLHHLGKVRRAFVGKGFRTLIQQTTAHMPGQYAGRTGCHPGAPLVAILSLCGLIAIGSAQVPVKISRISQVNAPC
jgi:hypothetical protein